MRPFVFPDKFFAEVDVGKTFSAIWLGCLRLKREAFAAGVKFERGLVPNQAADVVEVRLGNGRFFLLNLRPFGDKFFRGDGFRHRALVGFIRFENVGY